MQLSVVDGPPVNASNAFYVSNRAPLEPSPFVKLPIGSITPRGWLRHQLELERDGMTGRLKEISPWLNFEGSAWANKQGKGERGWEELPYWLKGYGDLGYVLQGRGDHRRSEEWIEADARHPARGRLVRPARPADFACNGKPDLWPHMVMLNVLQSYYEFSGDPRVLDLMTRYFKWENAAPGRAHSARATGRRFAPATTSKASTGSTTAPAKHGCSSWRRRSTRTWQRWDHGRASTGTT